MKTGEMNRVEAKSNIKKMKDIAFARNVCRDDIKLGAEEIGINLDEHIRNVRSI